MPDYKKLATSIRRQVVKMLYEAQTCHLGSDMSVIDILTVLYFGVMKPEDIFIMSKGHGAAALYATLAEKGIIDREDLKTYGQEGTKYLNLCNREVKGVYTSTGSLGHGLPIAVGAAMASPHKRVFCLISDGELDCGTTWECALLAAHHKLSNLTLIVDSNGWQATGYTEEVLDTEPLLDKFEAFGFESYNIDGHNYEQLEESLEEKMDKPIMLQALTLKGFPISFATDNNDFHYANLTGELYEKALSELV